MDLHIRKLTAIRSDEVIFTRAISIGCGACAIRLDAIRPRDAIVTNDLLAVNVQCKYGFHLTLAVKDLIACQGERPLLIALDLYPIVGEQVRPVERGLRALRCLALVLGKSGPDSARTPTSPTSSSSSTPAAHSALRFIVVILSSTPGESSARRWGQ